MAEAKWIKVTTDIFDDDKILLIESMPGGDSIIVIWFKLLCLAGKQNNSGVFVMSNGIPYTEKMLSTIFRRKESTIKHALDIFEQFGMIEVIENAITISNWGKHQNLDQLENRKEYMRNYMKDYRGKQRDKLGNSKLCEVGLNIEEWKLVLDYFNYECAYCGEKEGLEQEHIVPLNKGGKYEIGNIVPSCRHCNASKGSKDFEEWYLESNCFDRFRMKKIKDYMCKTNVNSLHKANVSRTDKIREEKNRKEQIREEVEEVKEENEITPPTLTQVIDFVKENNLSVNPNRYYTYYSERDWKTSNGNPIDWKAKIQEWDFTDKQKAESKSQCQTSNNPFLELAKDENLF